MTEERLVQIDLESLATSRQYFPSPLAWEDEVFYFLMLDRFSDGNENGYKDNAGNLVQGGTTPLYTSADAENAVKTEGDAERWREAGVKYVGGTLKGFASACRRWWGDKFVRWCLGRGFLTPRRCCWRLTPTMTSPERLG